MRLQLAQDIIDVIRGKKEVHIEFKKKGIILDLPKKFAQNACYKNNKKTGIYCFGYDNFKGIINHNKKKLNLLGLYKKGNVYSADKVDAGTKTIYDAQITFLKENLFPILKKTDFVCDVGCASGDVTFMFPEYVKEIEGIEYFQKYVDSANNKAKDLNIQNIHFCQGDIKNYKFDKKYDHILFLGVLPHIFRDEEVKNIFAGMYNALNDGGCLTIRCNISDDERDFFNIDLNHTAISYSKQKMEKFLKDAGFELEKGQWLRTKEIDIPQLNTKAHANHWTGIYRKNASKNI